MADILQQHCGFGDLHHSQQNFSLHEASEPVDFKAEAISSPGLNVFARQAMAQPLLQRYPGPQDGMHNQVWHAMHEGPSLYPGGSAPATSVNANNTTLAQQSAWRRDAAIDAALFGTHGLPSEPLIMQDADLHLGPNSHLHYTSAQNTTTKSDWGYGAGFASGFPGPVGSQRPVSVFHGSDFDTIASSLSPKSRLSDLSEPDKIESDGAVDMTSPGDAWIDYRPRSQGEIKQSHSTDTLSSTVSFHQRNIQHLRPAADAHSSGRSDARLDIRPALGLSQSSYTMMGVASTGDTWVQPFGHNGVATSNPWCSSAYSDNASRLPYYQEASAFTRPSGQGDQRLLVSHGYGSRVDDPYRPSGGGSVPQREAPLQDTFQVCGTANSHAERKADDTILLEGKALGLTYKEIRRKLRSNVAESTLRGRYRSLTKARKDRVRKPVWKEGDIKLLKDIVTLELDRLDNEGTRVLNREQRMSKVSWKKVADYIAERGGSYHFGNSTCKKKWAEIELAG